MSLVNEALKKARLEAARQDAAKRGLPPPGTHATPSSPLAPSLTTKVAAAVVLAIVALLIFWAGRRSLNEAERTVAVAEAPARPVVPEEPAATTASAPQEVPAAEPAAEAPPAVPEPAARPEPPAPRPEPVAEPVAQTTTSPPPAPRDRPRPRARAPQPQSPPAQTPAPAAAAPRAEPEPPAARPAPATSPPPAAEPQSFVRTLELPGARLIELGGIAWSEDRPFALINGRVVGPGDRVEELTVVSVQPQHVELSGDTGRYLLRLK